MLNTEDSPCKREVETLTEQEAELFLKLVKLYKNKDFNSPQVDNLETLMYEESQSKQQDLYNQMRHELGSNVHTQVQTLSIPSKQCSTEGSGFTARAQQKTSVTTKGFQAALFITPPKLDRDEGHT